MKFMMWTATLLLAGAFACSSDGAGSSGGFGGNAQGGPGGTGGAATGGSGPIEPVASCSSAPDCAGCTSCAALCTCEGNDQTACIEFCTAGAGGSAGVPGVGGTGGMGTGAVPSQTFSWPESPPGNPCRAGRYVGCFDGMWSSSLTFIGLPIPVVGNVDMTLVEGQSGEFLEISQGSVTGVANETFPYQATISGRLDCRTFQFDGLLVNADYVAIGVAVPWSGTVTAGYDANTSTFVPGGWSGVETANNAFGGSGVWKATIFGNPLPTCP